MGRYFVVVYTVCGIHNRFRCYVENKTAARKLCIEKMQIKDSDIVKVYEERM